MSESIRIDIRRGELESREKRRQSGGNIDSYQSGPGWIISASIVAGENELPLIDGRPGI